LTFCSGYARGQASSTRTRASQGRGAPAGAGARSGASKGAGAGGGRYEKCLLSIPVLLLFHQMRFQAKKEET